MKGPAPLENLSSLLNIILVFFFSELMSNIIFTHSWYCLMPSLKLLINYQEPSIFTGTYPRQNLSSGLKWQSGWRSGTLHVLWHCWLQGSSAWSCFWGGRLIWTNKTLLPTSVPAVAVVPNSPKAGSSICSPTMAQDRTERQNKPKGESGTKGS